MKPLRAKSSYLSNCYWTRHAGALCAVASAFHVACADETSSPSRGDNQEGATVATFSVKSELPKCNASRFGEVYYVSSEEQLYYCDGAELRPIEVVGEPGADGTNWLVSLAGATPATCENGGVAIEVGPDIDGDGVLDGNEVAGSAAVCNGADGATGPQGEDGEDGEDGGDGQDGEDGEDGLSALVRVTTEDSGANCEHGGTRIDVGLDDNRSGSLDEDEIDGTSFVCQPAPAIGCGDGQLTPPETCDTAIETGTGSCPTSCDDGNSCTTDTLSGSGCETECSHAPITAPLDGDSCCPSGQSAATDDDCAGCGNGRPDSGETCDDGNTENGDECPSDCGSPPELQTRAFRLIDLDLRDPHVFVQFIGCVDVTDNPLVGFGVNNEVQQSIQADGDFDGLLDYSPLVVFPAFDQTASQASEIVFGECAAPLAQTSCTRGDDPGTETQVSYAPVGTCLGVLPNTGSSYSPQIVTTTGPCFTSSPRTLTISMSGIPVTLRDAQFAATYQGSPASTLRNGLLRGFLSESDAQDTTIPTTVPLVGGQPLSALLPGGARNCATHDDRDVNVNTSGWWFYFNFTAQEVPYEP